MELTFSFTSLNGQGQDEQIPFFCLEASVYMCHMHGEVPWYDFQDDFCFYYLHLSFEVLQSNCDYKTHT